MIAATGVQRDGHSSGAIFEDGVDDAGVLARESIRVGSVATHLCPNAFIAQESECHVIELQIGTAGCGEVGDLGLVGTHDVGPEFAEICVADLSDAPASAAQMQIGRSGNAELRRALRRGLQELEMIEHDRPPAADTALNRQHGANLLPVPLIVAEADRVAGARRGDPLEPGQKIGVPGCTTKFPVGDRLEPNRLLERDDLANGPILLQA
jgi:hypothetical protein